MTLQQAIDVLEYRHKWFNIKTINATLGDVHALFSFQEKWQSEYGTNPFDDRVMMDAIAVIIDHHRSPSRPQESDTEPKGVFYEAKQAALDYIQKAKDGPTPEPFMPKEGDVLIAIDPCVIETIGTHEGKSALTVNKEYRVMEDYGSLIVVINDFAERHEFTLETIHKYFKRKE